jgi:hypothetical protein
MRMIFCSKLLFLHVPKTGGMSVSELLLRILPAPIYYSAPLGHHGKPCDGVVFIAGARHETLEEAQNTAAAYGYRLSDFPVVLAGLRNPYELEVSRYAYLRKGHPFDHGLSQELALSGDFERFAVDSPPHMGRPLESYFLLHGRMPKNLCIVRLEQISVELQSVLCSIGLDVRIRLPRTNRSRHRHYARYYTPSVEEVVYEKYRWAFEAGGYERMRFDSDRLLRRGALQRQKRSA